MHSRISLDRVQTGSLPLEVVGRKLHLRVWRSGPTVLMTALAACGWPRNPQKELGRAPSAFTGYATNKPHERAQVWTFPSTDRPALLCTELVDLQELEVPAVILQGIFGVCFVFSFLGLQNMLFGRVRGEGQIGAGCRPCFLLLAGLASCRRFSACRARLSLNFPHV